MQLGQNAKGFFRRHLAWDTQGDGDGMATYLQCAFQHQRSDFLQFLQVEGGIKKEALEILGFLTIGKIVVENFLK